MIWNDVLKFSRGALTIGAMIGTMAIAMPAVAHDTDAERRQVRDVIVKRIHAKKGEPIVIDHRELSELRGRCTGGRKAESDVSSGEGDRKFRTRIIVCSDGDEAAGETNSRLLEALERARAKLEDHDDLSGKHREEAIAALDREIARVRAQQD